MVRTDRLDAFVGATDERAWKRDGPPVSVPVSVYRNETLIYQSSRTLRGPS